MLHPIIFLNAITKCAKQNMINDCAVQDVLFFKGNSVMKLILCSNMIYYFLSNLKNEVKAS